MAKKERNITRMEYGRTRGWWVRIYRGTGESRVCHSKLFSDSASSTGKRGALRLAIRWRNAELEKLPKAEKSRHGTPGKVGQGYVRRAEVKQRVGWHPAWTGFIWTGPRRWATTKWSINRWGSREAKRRCEAWLKQKRKELRG